MRASEERHGLIHRPYRSHTRSSHSRAVVSSLLLLGVLFLDGLAVGAQAYTTQTWNTTALFDGGTKASTSTITDTCENVTANGLALNNMGNYQGIGLTTGTSTCATGAWGVNPSGLVLAYDMQTLNAGNMKDFSGVGNDGTIAGTAVVSGAFGKARNFRNTVTDQVNISASSSLNANAITVGAWVRQTSTCSPGCGIFEKSIANVVNSQYLLFLDPGFHFRIRNSTTVVNARYNPAPANNVWYYISGSAANGVISVWANGTPLAASTYSASIVQGVGISHVGSLSSNIFPDNGYIDELQVWTRNLTLQERIAVSTDGRSSFLSSGSWASPNVAFTSTPAFVTLTGTGFTSSNRPSRLRFLSSSGTVVFDTLIPSGLASPIQIPVNLTFNPSTWKVRLDMIGNGTATATMTSILVTLGAAPLFQSSDILFLFGFLLVGLCVFGLLPEGAEFPMITIVASLILALWGLLFFYPQVANPVYLVGIVGLAVLFLALGIGKLMTEAIG